MDPTESAHWMWDFRLFIQELEINFGPHDPEGDAENALSNLTMKDSHRVSKYIVDFNKFAARLDWNESALRNQFYCGLPLRLCTEILKGGKPTSLAALCHKAQECDQVHWLTKDETAKESKSSSGKC